MDGMEPKVARNVPLAIAMLALFAFIVGLMAWRFVAYYAEQSRPIVSQYNVWAERGLPVDVCVTERAPFRVWSRTTAASSGGGTLVTYVTRNMMERIRAGQAAFVDIKGSSVPARVSSVSRALDIDTGLFEVRLRVDGESSLPAQAFYHVRINTRTIPGAIMVPVESVQDLNGGKTVWTVEDGAARELAVSEIFSDGVNVILTGEGLAGRSVVTRGFERLNDGKHVSVHDSGSCNSGEG